MLHEELRCLDDDVDFLELSSADDESVLLLFSSGQLSDRCLLASWRVLANLEEREMFLVLSRGRVSALARLLMLLLF